MPEGPGTVAVAEGFEEVGLLGEVEDLEVGEMEEDGAGELEVGRMEMEVAAAVEVGWVPESGAAKDWAAERVTRSPEKMKRRKVMVRDLIVFELPGCGLEMSEVCCLGAGLW